jgi:hypothetical protein
LQLDQVSRLGHAGKLRLIQPLKQADAFKQGKQSDRVSYHSMILARSAIHTP